MTRKPKSRKYRNLVTYRGSIYYDRVVNGRRWWRNLRIAPESADAWKDAAGVRDKLEALENIEQRRGDVPTFAEFARRWLAEDTQHLAHRTLKDRRRHLQPDGLLMRRFGAKRLDDISPEMIRDWRAKEINASPKRQEGTGRNYLNVLSSIFAFAQELGFISENPVVVMRSRERKKRGKSTRTKSDIKPIEKPWELAALVESAREEGPLAACYVLLCLDAGLRPGEALALRWANVLWGESEDDRARALYICENLPEGGSGESEDPKDGDARRVGLSRRLYRALWTLFRERFRADPNAYDPQGLVLAGIDRHNFRRQNQDYGRRESPWARICRKAGIGQRQIKNLRHSYASHLLSVGVPLGYIQTQLGHLTPLTTATFYAKWIEMSEYREPMRVGEDELPADLLARICQESPSNPRHGGSVEFESNQETPPQILMDSLFSDLNAASRSRAGRRP